MISPTSTSRISRASCRTPPQITPSASPALSSSFLCSLTASRREARSYSSIEVWTMSSRLFSTNYCHRTALQRPTSMKVLRASLRARSSTLSSACASSSSLTYSTRMSRLCAAHSTKSEPFLSPGKKQPMPRHRTSSRSSTRLYSLQARPYCAEMPYARSTWPCCTPSG